jgi:hypothetical protein
VEERWKSSGRAVEEQWKRWWYKRRRENLGENVGEGEIAKREIWKNKQVVRVEGEEI